MAQDHNIKIRLESFKTQKATSSSGSASNKRTKTSPDRGITRSQMFMGAKSAMKKGIAGVVPIAGVALAITAAGKAARIVAKSVGHITNNRYRERRTMDGIGLVMNPWGTIAKAHIEGVKHNIEIMRENKRIDYERSLYNNVLPYPNKDGGITL